MCTWQIGWCNWKISKIICSSQRLQTKNTEGEGRLYIAMYLPNIEPILSVNVLVALTIKWSLSSYFIFKSKTSAK